MAISCARCGASAGPDAAFCSACGAPLASEAAERKLATLVFADLVGSTEMIAGRDPEEVRGLLDPFYELARGVLEHHGGRVEKFIGDAVVAAFGVPRAHGDDPDRALAAALALVDRLAAHDPRLVLRIGIETGEVLAGPRGGELAVTGDVANAAARLQQAARPGEVLVGERARRAIRAARLVEHSSIEAKGFSAPLRAWRAVGAADAGEDAVEEAPFLGRGGELDQLRLAHLSSVRERRPRLVLLVGEAGSGKTRLVRELIGELRHLEPEPTVIVGRNPPYGDGIAFWALGEILRDAAGAAPASSAAAVRELLSQRLAALGVQQAHDTAAVLAATLAADGTATESSDLRRAWRRLLSALADEAPGATRDRRRPLGRRGLPRPDRRRGFAAAGPADDHLHGATRDREPTAAAGRLRRPGNARRRAARACRGERVGGAPGRRCGPGARERDRRRQRRQSVLRRGDRSLGRRRLRRRARGGAPGHRAGGDRGPHRCPPGAREDDPAAGRRARGPLPRPGAQ